jgi:hypothetical protein
MRVVFIIAQILVLCAKLQAQVTPETSVWYTEFGNIVEFNNSNTIVKSFDQSTYITGRYSSICDQEGKLLFYTDGAGVYDSTRQLFENGNDLVPEHAGVLTAVIVPHPGDAALYYIFIANPWIQGSSLTEGLNYALVDVREKKVLKKREVLLGKVASFLSVTKHADEHSFWVVAHGATDSLFYSYNVKENGISAPVTSPGVGRFYLGYAGQLKISPDGTRLAITKKGVNLYGFNSKEGLVTKEVSIGEIKARGVEFSPNSKFLYASTSDGLIYQYDVSLSLDEIAASQIEVGNGMFSDEFSDLQLAHDRMIYVAFGSAQSTSYLPKITNPNQKGVSCDYQLQGLRLRYANIQYLPASVQSFFRDDPSLEVDSTCTNKSATMEILGLGYADSLSWNFGDGNTGTFPLQSGRRVSHAYDTPGKYPVSVQKYISGVVRHLRDTIFVIAEPSVNLGEDTTLCVGQSLDLFIDPLTTSNCVVQWSTGDTSDKIRVSNAAKYQVTVDNGVCFRTDEIVITVSNYPDLQLPRDTVLCDSNPFTLSVPADKGYEYLWSNNATDPTFSIVEPGKFWLNSSNGPCVRIDTVNVTYKGLEDIKLRSEHNETGLYHFELLAENGESYNWMFGDSASIASENSFIEYQYPFSGDYKMRAVVTNSFGCRDSLDLAISIPRQIFIPNVVTYNGDEKNDFFDFISNSDGAIHLKIFTREGVMIFETNSRSFKWPTNHANGVYFYTLLIGAQSYKGSIHVMNE